MFTITFLIVIKKQQFLENLLILNPPNLNSKVLAKYWALSSMMAEK